jgi:hypothetical protein
VITLAVIGVGFVLVLLAMFAKHWLGRVRNLGLGILLALFIALMALTVDWGDDE